MAWQLGNVDGPMLNFLGCVKRWNFFLAEYDENIIFKNV